MRENKRFVLLEKVKLKVNTWNRDNRMEHGAKRIDFTVHLRVTFKFCPRLMYNHLTRYARIKRSILAAVSYRSTKFSHQLMFVYGCFKWEYFITACEFLLRQRNFHSVL